MTLIELSVTMTSTICSFIWYSNQWGQ